MSQNQTSRGNKIKVNKVDTFIQILIYLIVILFCLAILLPCLNVLVLSFNDGKDAARGGIWFWPRVFTLDNFKEVFKDGSIMTAYGISIARTVIGTFLSLMVTTLAGFALKQKDLPGNKLITVLITFTMLFSGGMIPSYLVVRNLGLINTIWALVLPGAVPIFSVIMVMNFFIGVPKSLAEAAIIDGATPLQVLTKVYIPCSKPVIATIALFSIVGSWNDFFGGLIYMTKVANYPLQTYIQTLSVRLEDILNSGGSLTTLVNAMEVSKQNLNAAKIVVSVIPLLLIYPILQKYLITGIVMGSVKE